MRPLTLAAAVLVTGIAAAATAGAEPTETPAAPTTSAAETPTASATATPTESATATTAASDTPTSSAASSSAEATSTTPSTTTPSTTTSSTVPAGAHQVTYTVTTTSDLTANIYYVSADPPDQSAANKPEYMPLARTQVGPGAPWTVQATLADPTKWAFVSASGGLRVNPEFHCEIAVDGKVIVSQQGGSGVQCALRPW